LKSIIQKYKSYNMSKSIRLNLVIGSLIIIFCWACKKDKDNPQMPTLTTTAATNISPNSATSGGAITSNGGAGITQSGICWSKTNNTPTTTDSVKAGITASGSFTLTINNLTENTTYYVRAFATNSVGTAYGNVINFTTTVDTTKVTFTYNGATVTYGVLTSTVTKRKWMDRNLGATRAATAADDYQAYGDLFQWGRPADGHQLINWTSSSAGTGVNGLTTVIATTDIPGNSSFIDASNTTTYDWRNDNNNNRWTTNSQGPCPTGWHVPTATEWAAEVSGSVAGTGGTATSGGITNSGTAYNNLKLTVSGYRRGDVSSSIGTVRQAGSNGWYWSSSSFIGIGWSGGIDCDFDAVSILTGNNAADDKAQGKSVRCIKN
jgi:uncharacterized protein (TIGR02145 family)